MVTAYSNKYPHGTLKFTWLMTDTRLLGTMTLAMARTRPLRVTSVEYEYEGRNWVVRVQARYIPERTV